MPAIKGMAAPCLPCLGAGLCGGLLSSFPQHFHLPATTCTGSLPPALFGVSSPMPVGRQPTPLGGGGQTFEGQHACCYYSCLEEEGNPIPPPPISFFCMTILKRKFWTGGERMSPSINSKLPCRMSSSLYHPSVSPKLQTCLCVWRGGGGRHFLPPHSQLPATRLTLPNSSSGMGTGWFRHENLLPAYAS